MTPDFSNMEIFLTWHNDQISPVGSTCQQSNENKLRLDHHFISPPLTKKIANPHEVFINISSLHYAVCIHNVVVYCFLLFIYIYSPYWTLCWHEHWRNIGGDLSPTYQVAVVGNKNKGSRLIRPHPRLPMEAQRILSTSRLYKKILAFQGGAMHTTFSSPPKGDPRILKEA